MDFKELNNQNRIDWGVDSKNFHFKKIKDFFDEGITKVEIKGFFITKSKNFGLQPCAILKDCLLNLPTHKLDTVQEIMQNPDMVQGVKNGDCWVEFTQFQSKYKKICYSFNFIDKPAKTTEPGNPLF